MLQRAHLLVASGLLCWAVAAGSAQATPLNLTLQGDPFPDIFSQFQSTSYNATTDALSVSAFVGILRTGGVDYAVSSGTFTLSATVDSTGALSAGGTLSITGTVGALSFTSGTLLTGSLMQIGFPDGTAGVLEFTFSVTGGDAASLYGGIGATGGVIVGITNGFPGNWNSNFSAMFSGVNDVGVPLQVIPEPSSALLLAPGLAVLALRRRRSVSSSLGG
jgi:hypothetical protein